MSKSSIFNNGQIVPAEIRELVVLPQPFPACLHNPTPTNGTSRLRFDLELTYRTYPERIRDFVARLLPAK